jgi:Arc/MetJ family transcription regulator
LGFFVTPPDPDKQGVDAVASATPQAVQAAVISGAAYTSWVLWRRVNGEITDRLLAMTLSHCSADYLNRCLLSDDSRFVQFALQHLLDKNLYDVRYREACFRILGKSGRTICQLTLQYLVAQVPDLGELNMRLTELIGVNDGSSRLILDYFERLSDAPPALWIQTAAQLGQVHTYYDVNAVLNLLKRRGGDSEAVRLEVVKLLQSEDRFIARRAQEFLGAQQ